MKRRITSERGQAMVEMAFVLPLLLVLVLGAIQFGILFNNYETITDATRAGARQAIVLRLNGGSAADAVQVVKDTASELDWTKPGASVSVTASSWTTPGSTVTVTTTYPYEVNLLGFVVSSGNLTSTMKERLE